MPQFNPGQNKTARVPVTVQPSGLSCEVELFLGPNDATKVASSGRKPFVSTGSQQQVNLPVVMPSTTGTYHVYIDLYVGGSYFKGYTGTEDVVIAAPGVDLVVGAFTFHSVNGIPFSSVGVDSDGMPYAVLAQPLVLSGLGGLSVSFTFQGFQDFSSSLFCGLWWSLSPEDEAVIEAAKAAFWAANPIYPGMSEEDYYEIMGRYDAAFPGYAPPFYATYTDIPYMSSVAVTKSVNINGLSNAGYGTMPRGNWIARIGLVVPGGGPGAYVRIKGVVLQ